MGTLQGARRDVYGLRNGAENPGKWVAVTDGGRHAGFTIKTLCNMLKNAHYPPASLLTLKMAKAKKTLADQNTAQNNAGAVVEGSRSRRAKTDALNNAVWKQLAPGAGKKRAASTSPQRKAVRKKARKNNNKDVVDATTKSSKQVELETPNGIANTSVSIHLPGAPKKKPMATKGGKASKSNRKGKKDDPVVAAEIETDKEDASVSTESIFSSDSEEDGDDDDDIVSVNDVMETGHQTQSAADKRFANEIKQPVWSDQTVGNATKESARQSLVGDSDKENDVNSQPRKTLLIRGQVIEITDEEDQNDLDESPSARLVPPSSRPSGGETLSNMGGRGTIWPFYTDLVKGNRDLVLNVQSHELKLIIRKAIDLIEERMRFLNAFPDFVLRTTSS
ncbi:hypothetical protein M378DRAFT_8155 [Amanita muscaria Koide BX008]|uniref:Uncharacterized protein n=1 Tax=Amanita muscaria (strain Koide BX008) TaxID=946122 RepID=A0A0C2SYS4_AMAMK|nr:hypothetical protein M378DRAFT_8155 [Amanita muscaria Koide BX008]